MARCLGSHCPYGYGHRAEHVEAAHKGWLTRRRGFSERDRRWLGRVTGDAQDIHTHGDKVVFTSRGKVYELPRGEARRLITAGREEERDELRQMRRDEHERTRQMRESERKERKEQREKERQERAYERIARAEYSDVLKTIREVGGIKRSISHASGREYWKGEYNTLPQSVRARRGQGVTLDYARERVQEHYPWLEMNTQDDLLRFFDKEHTRRQNRPPRRQRTSTPVITLRRVGDFYEAEGDEAHKLESATGVRAHEFRTGRTMAGFPAQTRDTYARKAKESGVRLRFYDPAPVSTPAPAPASKGTSKSKPEYTPKQQELIHEIEHWQAKRREAERTKELLHGVYASSVYAKKAADAEAKLRKLNSGAYRKWLHSRAVA